MRLRAVNSRVPALLSMVCILVAGCAATPHGEVTGIARAYGGPLDPTTSTSVQTGQPAPAHDVTFVDDKGNRTTATSDAEGRFSVSLSPAKYTLLCGSHPQIEITAGSVATVDCEYSVD